MSEVAPTPTRRGRRFDLLAMLVIGVVIVSAALLPAVTANSGETTTVRGDVTLDGRPLPFFPVGFWTQSPGSRSSGVVATTQTDANGGFTLDIPATLDGFAYAGTAPDSTRAILTVAGRDVVRGVVGSQGGRSATQVLYQGRPPGTARSLAGGAAQLHFHLQQPGRLSGTSPVPADRLRAVQVRRLDGSVVQTLRLDSRRRFTSMPLVPGTYGVVLVPKSPDLPAVATATVVAGTTQPVELPLPGTGATVLGTVRADSHPVAAGVPVLLEQAGKVLAATTTSSSGDWSFPGIAAGDYAVEVGRFDQTPALSASGVQVPIPGASPTPTPTASTASASPSPTPTSPEAAAVVPVPRTADAVLPQTFAVTVPDVLGEVAVATDVASAARITGVVSRPDRISGTEQADVRVLVQEASSDRIVRATTADDVGRYSVAGLRPGTRYRVWAVTRPDDPTLAQMGGASVRTTTTSTTADVVVDRPALTLTGTVTDTRRGKVQVGDAALLAGSSTIDRSGAYSVAGLVPAAYPVVVTTGGHVAADPVGVLVAGADDVVDLQPGPLPAVFKGWFLSSGAGVPAITGAALDDRGDAVRFGPLTDGGHVTVGRLRPGTYAYDAESFRGSAPVADGPWFFDPPSGDFTLSGGATTDVGPIVLRTRSH